MPCLTSAPAQPAQNYLANNTVLIVRHAEKPVEGTGLTPMGEARAQLYAKYFQPFQEGGFPFRLIASMREPTPRTAFARG